MVTEFGKALRKMRIERNEYLKDMADKFGISVAYLSAMENGKRNVPDDFIQKLAELYRLSASEAERLDQLKEMSAAELKIPLNGKSDRQRKTLLTFAKALDGMSNEELDRILHLIQKRD